jgi:uncharacterized protein (DUF305 family)
MKLLTVALFAVLFAIGAVSGQETNNNDNGFVDVNEPNFIAGKGTFVISEGPSVEKILSVRTLELLDNESNNFEERYITMLRDHHEAGIEMSEIILAKTDNAAIEDLANRIISANREDLDDLNEVLAELNDTNATNETNASANGLSEEDRVAESVRMVHAMIHEKTNEWLANLPTDKAELAYLKLMKEHHVESIKLSQIASVNLENETLVNWSARLVARQLSEIGEMFVIETDLTVEPSHETMPFGQFVRSLVDNRGFTQRSAVADENANNTESINESVDENISETEQISENEQNETSDENDAIRQAIIAQEQQQNETDEENDGFLRRLIDRLTNGDNSSADNTSNNTSVVENE